MTTRFTTDMSPRSTRAIAGVVLIGLLTSVVMAGLLAFYASPQPDGLESVAQQQGFSASAEESVAADSPFAGYGVAGVEDQRWSAGLAGVAGVAITVVLGFGLFRLLVRRPQPPGADG